MFGGFCHCSLFVGGQVGSFLLCGKGGGPFLVGNADFFLPGHPKSSHWFMSDCKVLILIKHWENGGDIFPHSGLPTSLVFQFWSRILFCVIIGGDRGGPFYAGIWSQLYKPGVN